MIVLAHDIEVDDDAGTVLTSGPKKLTDAVGHETRLPCDASGVDAMYRRMKRRYREALWRRLLQRTNRPDPKHRSIGEDPARPAMMDKPLRC
ncbi:hypothetical protein D9M68_918690 [compost metagenome]